MISYVLAVDLIALVTIIATLRLVDVTGRHWIWLAILAAGSAVHIEGARRIERLREVVAEGVPYVNLKGMWTFAGILVLPPPLAVVLIASTYIHSWFRLRRVPPYRWCFSAATVILAGALGALCLAAISPLTYPGYPHGPIGLVAASAAGLAYWFVNYALVVGAVMLSNPTGRASKALGRLSDQFIVAGALGLGVAIAVVLASEPWALVMLLLTVLGLHRALLVGQFQDASQNDPLTGLANQVFWYQLAGKELERAERTTTPLGMLYLDLDHFKDVNDAYGHAAGDTVLKTIAVELRRELRGDDLVGRLGGEEFAVLLPNTTAADTTATAERIRRRIAALTVEVTASTGLATIDGLSCSIGVATYPDTGQTVADLSRAADTAMYAAKNAGRDRVVTAQPDTGPES
ncbi:GGDEF domain-containing protein [Kribbella sp. NBC_01505]|uniref:GGDEF domain-containing protein n=1 Tax=Kribbella sp. NBC_01505 TaxID=2903580 RepID=UPI00386C436F